MEQSVLTPVPHACADAELIGVTFLAGESYEVMVRGRRIVVDQPIGSGANGAPTPVELFVASLATCMAFYAGRYLTNHGYGRDGLVVSAGFAMASGRPARVTTIDLVIQVPAELPAERRSALRAVVGGCTVHNTLVSDPSITFEIA